MAFLSSSMLVFAKLRSSLNLYFQVIMKASERHQVPSHSISSYNDNFRHGRRNSFEKMGISGYDPEEKDMRGVFMARGPGIELSTFICMNDLSTYEGRFEFANFLAADRRLRQL